MPTWPASLPQDFLIDGFETVLSPAPFRSQTEYGPAESRRRTTAEPRPVRGEMVLTKTQAATLQSFYGSDTKGGSLSFDWLDPINGAAATFRFVEAPRFFGENQYLRAQLALEILP